MTISLRFVSNKIWQNSHLVKAISKEAKALSSSAQELKHETNPENNDSQTQTKQSSNTVSLEKHRYIYPEFLPDPNPIYRNIMREKLERFDMLARRSVINIPEFYVGSVLSVTYSEPHATGKVNKFVGICIQREGCGLRAAFVLRNIVDGEGVEVRYDLYDPAIQKIVCLRLEKRLDKELFYLRDAPPEYSTFPFDLEAELVPEGTPVPVNETKVPLKDQKWSQRWELKDLKGVKELVINEKRQRKARALARPWEKYDLMKTYRETISQEEQEMIFSELQTELCQLEAKKNILKHKRVFTRPKKNV
ncbi:39S ribosomal protein L19, mitochondrial [Colletes gigas]|uniref:39S ribosomal protein L19, mitochondrial n=1 Tax=Colletes gigas TaxID=935657 RepID=UPI001C9BA068|nr:39S ribosomal protein L19, mitochondrial [Colletes gigas]